MIFIKEVLSEFISKGSIAPSSSFLTKRMIEPIKTKKGLLIVELGAGNGVFTGELLKLIPADGRLIVFELDPVLFRHLKRKFSDQRITIVNGDAAQLSVYLLKLNINKVDYIVSGLPIGNFNYSVRNQIFSEIYTNLSEDGVYIQFQYFLASLRHISKIFNTRIIAYEIRNIPPAFVYQCKK